MAEIRVEPMTAADDLPICAQICSDAVKLDTFAIFLDRYNTESFYDSTMKRLTDAINPDNKTDFAFKAVLTVDDGRGGKIDEIVGVSHWYVGYVVVPKYDPFAKKVIEPSNVISPAEVAVGDESGAVTPHALSKALDRSKSAMEEMQRVHGNMYVGKIRGKKHVYLRRMMVHPKHQRKGIGRRLLQWGLDEADRQKIVSWLFARPAAVKMYQDAGFQSVGVTECRIPEGDDPLHVDPGMAMLREPQPYTGA